LKIVQNSRFFWVLACLLFNYEKTEKRHFGNIFTPFGVGEFTGMEGNMAVFLTVGETKKCTKNIYRISFRCERICKCSKEWRAIWTFI